MGIFSVLLLYSLWSTSFPIGKWLLAFASPVFLTGVRMSFAGILISLFIILKYKRLPNLSKKQWLSLLLLGFLSIYLSNVLEFYGLQSLSAAKTCFIYSLSPFFSALFSYLHFGEKMNKMKWLGMIIGFLGFTPSLDFSSDFSFRLSTPEVAVMGAAVASVYGWTLLRVVVKDNEISPLVANGFSMLFGGIFALTHSVLTESWNPYPMMPNEWPNLLTGVMAMTVISNFICYNLYGLMLKRYTATFLSFFGLLSPIFASLNAWLLINETPSLKIFISTFIVSIGLWIFYRNELKQGYIKQKETFSA
jgi:drug/metabolite transporter (DMT)-like permease